MVSATRGPRPAPVEERFAKKVCRRGEYECWPWTAQRSNNGYGRFGVGSRTNGTKRGTYAHRVAWELENGPIPAGMHVLHRCDTPSCVNPNHLFLGTPADNVADMMAKGRGRWPGVSGERHHHAKFTAAAVADIRTRAGRGERGTALAREFGVTKSAIYHVVHGRNW